MDFAMAEPSDYSYLIDLHIGGLSLEHNPQIQLTLDKLVIKCLLIRKTYQNKRVTKALDTFASIKKEPQNFH